MDVTALHVEGACLDSGGPPLVRNSGIECGEPTAGSTWVGASAMIA